MFSEDSPFMRAVNRASPLMTPSKSPFISGSPRIGLVATPESLALPSSIGVVRTPEYRDFGKPVLPPPKKETNQFVVNYLCLFFFSISMALKSNLPFMVDFFKSVGYAWLFGTYNGLYYLGRVIANVCLKRMSTILTIKQMLMLSICISLVGNIFFTIAVNFPNSTTISLMLLGQCMQGLATGWMCGAIGLYMKMFHRGDQNVAANFGVAYNVGDICGPIISLPFVTVGLPGLCWLLLIVPIVLGLTTWKIVPSGLVPVDDVGGEGGSASTAPFKTKAYLMLAGCLTAFYTSYEFNNPVLFDSLGYSVAWISIFLDVMAFSAICGSFGAKFLPNWPQTLNCVFITALGCAYMISTYRWTGTYLATLVIVCIIGELMAIVNDTVVISRLSISEYAIYKNCNEGGRVFLQPLFAWAMAGFPATFFMTISIIYVVTLGILLVFKPLQEVEEDNIRQGQMDEEIDLNAKET